MTVNELIAELQVLSAQGHGELDVVAYRGEECERTTSLSIEVVEESEPWWRLQYWDDVCKFKSIKHVSIEEVNTP